MDNFFFGKCRNHTGFAHFPPNSDRVVIHVIHNIGKTILLVSSGLRPIYNPFSIGYNSLRTVQKHRRKILGKGGQPTCVRFE